MRQIKFRALCDADDKKQMLYFGMMQFDNGIASWPTPDDVVHIDEYYSPLMQFTGLCDTNGKEIYEGDIVNFSFDGVLHIESGNYIKFEDGAFLIHKPYFCPLASDANFIEVIGNIYEHSHLLNDGPNPEECDTTDAP